MPHSFLLRAQVRKGVRGGLDFAGHLSNDFDTRINQGVNLVRVIREKTHSTDAKVMQDGGRQTEIAAIREKAQGLICFDRVQPAILKRVSVQLRHQAYTTTLLMFIDQQPATVL